MKNCSEKWHGALAAVPFGRLIFRPAAVIMSIKWMMMMMYGCENKMDEVYRSHLLHTIAESRQRKQRKRKMFRPKPTIGCSAARLLCVAS